MSERVRFPIDGMTCMSCASRITRAVRGLDGVESVKVDLGSDSCVVSFDPDRTSLVVMAEAVRRAGYEAQLDRVEPYMPAERKACAGTNPDR